MAISSKPTSGPVVSRGNPGYAFHYEEDKMNKLIALYGGTKLNSKLQRFVRRLARDLLTQPDIVIVTGGFDRLTKEPNAVSTDRAALEGAREYLLAEGVELGERFQTWIPEPAKDREGVIRFREGKVVELVGRSAQARRFDLAQQVDAILTVKGKKHTAMLLDMALAINRLALPLPFTGGDSTSYWKGNREQIVDWFKMGGSFAQGLENFSFDSATDTEVDELSRQLARCVTQALNRTCLVLSAFRPESDVFDKTVLEPAIGSAGFTPVRLDRTPDRGNVAAIFLGRLTRSDGVIADVTDGSPNVLYEIGQAHARGIEPMLLSRSILDGRVWDRLPFYLREHKVEAADASTPEGVQILIQRVRAYLSEVRATPQREIRKRLHEATQ
jgi:hypothetical protein